MDSPKRNLAWPTWQHSMTLCLMRKAWSRQGLGKSMRLYPQGGYKKDGARLYAVVPHDRTRATGTSWKTRSSVEQLRNPFYWEDDWALMQVAQRHSGVFLLGDLQKPSGHDSVWAILGRSGSTPMLSSSRLDQMSFKILF